MKVSVRLSRIGPKRRAIAIAIACGSLFVLPSCIPDLRRPAPGPILPETFNGDANPENASRVTIEDFFSDPLLTCLIHQALFGNQELRILAEDVQIASNEILARIGAYQPSIGPTGSITMDRYSRYTLPGAGVVDDPYFPGRYLPNPLPNFALGASLFWTPDIYWQLHNARDAAAMRFFAAGEGRKYVVTSVVAEIADLYYSLLAFDKRLENLDMIIALQEQSLRFARLKMRAGQGTDLAVQRFLAEVRKNQAEKLIVLQDIIQAENRINFLVGRYPQPIERRPLKAIEDYIELNLHALNLGVPTQLLENRPDVRRAERELAATGLDVQVAKKNFYPRGFISAGVGYEAFNPRYLFLTPEALVGQVAANMIVPFINRKAIKADYFSANARQLQAVYNYQRTLLNAFTEVITRVSRVQNYLRSIEIKKQQVTALERSVDDAMKLFRAAQAEYIDVLLAQRDLWQARRELIDTKREQLSAAVNTYQALGGGAYLAPAVVPQSLQHVHSKHFWRFFKDAAAGGPMIPPPVPPVPPGGGPILPPARPEADRGQGSPPAPPADRGPGPLPTPPAETSLEPLPATMGGRNGAGTGPDTPDPPR